ncbi:unnamed protein product [Didymodactylos carnosus]|uniref:Uncharacterized protein n=1 Tax=Didymodactylos carnosus TaxID=1234261 RepID=A0A813YGH9_9BILA|nr:unnamed protein product [Didymodactylos carnosus]CAF1278460.1 unnamed protein product [Didymodactylos carnosus]CAF3669615.1 unnamed protein product [Didymodactylos carnosus]CAF4083396.1 unnamed protein product [Didymodactylos carnosus]
MPINEFNPYDKESWYFENLSRAEANDILAEHEGGTFLVRDSATLKGDYVLCVKEGVKVMHYIINKIEQGDTLKYKIGQNHFDDMASLLKHYTLHYLDTAPLLKPVIRPSVINGKERQIASGLDSIDKIKRTSSNDTSISNDSMKSDFTDSSNSHTDERDDAKSTLKLPAKARVIKNRIPSLYDKHALRLEIDDIIYVTKADNNGQCEGRLLSSNRQGTFPFNYVEFFDDDDNSNIINNDNNREQTDLNGNNSFDDTNQAKH